MAACANLNLNLTFRPDPEEETGAATLLDHLLPMARATAGCPARIARRAQVLVDRVDAGLLTSRPQPKEVLPKHWAFIQIVSIFSKMGRLSKLHKMP